METLDRDGQISADTPLQNLTDETNSLRKLRISGRAQSEEAKFGRVQSNEANSYLI